MLRAIITIGSQFRYLVIVVALALVVFGFTQVNRMPVDVLPEFTPPYVEIQTEALGLSAKEIEQMITVPMEQDLLSGVAWLDTIRSESLPGLSSIVVYFEPGTDLLAARQMVAERMTQAVALPHVSKPPIMLQPLSASSRFIIVGLSSKTLTPIQTSVLARWTVGPRLMGVPGVSNVAIWGQRDRQLQVQVSPEQLRAQDVSLQQVLETTGNSLWVSSLSFLEASTPGTGGFIDTPQQRLGIWHVSPISSAQELAKVPVEGSNLTLGEVAKVVEDHQPLIGDAMANDSTSLFLVIEKLPNANTLEVTRNVENALAAMAPGLTGVDIDTKLFRPASYIESALGNLSRSALIAFALLVVLLSLFFHNWRLTLIAAITIPLSLAIAVAVLYWRGATLNTMVLIGLMVGLAVIIDDVIIDLDNVGRQLRQRTDAIDIYSRNYSAEVILSALLQTRGAVFFAGIISILAIIPVLSFQGILGSILQPMVQAYILAVLVSLGAALLVTSALCIVLLSTGRPIERGESGLARVLRRTYGRLIEPVLRSPRIAYAIVAVLAVVTLIGAPMLGTQTLANTLLPAFRENDLMVQIQSAPGTSQPEMVRLVTQASREVKALPGVLNVGTNIGRAIFGDQKVSINSAQMWVNIDPAANYESTVANIQEVVSGYPGLAGHVQTYLSEKGQSGLSHSDSRIYVRVFGENLETLKQQAQSVQKIVAGVAGVKDATVSNLAEEATVEIEVNLEAAQAHGIRPGDVRRTAAILISGLQVGSLFEDQKVFDVVVWSTPDTRNSVDRIRDLLIDTPSGGHVRLADVAEVRVASSPAIIRRESISPYLDIEFSLQGRGASAVAADIQTALKAAQFPLEYHAEVLGSYATQQETLTRALLAIAIVAIGIFLLLQATFGSWRLALIVSLLLCTSVAGGIVMALITGGGKVTLGTLAALFLVFIIAARNSSSLIAHYQRMLQQESVSFSMAIVLQGSREQIVPICMTAAALALVFAPFLVIGNVAGHELIYPMAPVIFGGLLTTLVLNAVVIPALFMRFGNLPVRAESASPSPIMAMPAQ